MKSSLYNLYFQANSADYTWIIANTHSGAIVVADDELKDLIEQPTAAGLAHLRQADTALMQTIVGGAFVVDDEIDEFGRTCIRFNWGRYTESLMHLTIIPAAGCNLRCTYCYETHHGRAMRKDVEAKVAAFVQSRAKLLERLSVVWFGGEPLLAKRTIKDLSRQFLVMSREHGFSYGASIITNGTLLDTATADMLVEAGVHSVQITLDGTPDVHNARRFYAKNRGPSFEDVLAGIRSCRGRLPVGIRINVDRSNIQRYPELIDRLFDEGLLGAGSDNTVSLGLVKRWTDIVETPTAALISGQDFERHLDELHAYVAHKNTAGSDGRNTQDTSAANAGALFIPKFPCAAIDRQNYVVMPDGKLKKCWIHATQEESVVGDISAGIDFDKACAVKWQAYDPTRDSECASCAYLPVCAGGCPYEMMEHPSLKSEHCTFIKRYTERNVRAAAQTPSGLCDAA